MHSDDSTSPTSPQVQEPDIIVEDERFAGSYTQVPNIVLRSHLISMGAKLTYAMLLSYAWQSGSCFPGQKRMAADLGCHEKSLRTYLKELEDQGVLIVRKRGQGRTNVYRLPRFLDDKRASYEG